MTAPRVLAVSPSVKSRSSSSVGGGGGGTISTPQRAVSIPSSPGSPFRPLNAQAQRKVDVTSILSKIQTGIESIDAALPHIDSDAGEHAHKSFCI